MEKKTTGHNNIDLTTVKKKKIVTMCKTLYCVEISTIAVKEKLKYNLHIGFKSIHVHTVLCF